MVAPAWKDHPETWPGLAVDLVLVAGDTRHTGTIVTVASLTVGDEVLCDNVPTIKIDDGRTIHGYECWWTASEPLREAS